MIFVLDAYCKKIPDSLKDNKWCYLGSPDSIKNAARAFKTENRVFLGRYIESITDSCRDNYVDYIGTLSELQENKLLWYSSRFASKSISQTSMFQQYVYLKLAGYLASVHDNIVFITDNNELLDNIRLLPVHGQYKIYKNSCSHFLVNFLKRIKCSISSYKYFFLLLYSKIFKKKHDLADYDVIIYSWIEDAVFTKLPEFNDIFFVNLESFLKAKGLKTGRMAAPVVSIPHLNKLNKYFDNVIDSLGYVSFFDLTRISLTVFKAVKPVNNSNNLLDFELLNFLLDNEIKRENDQHIFKKFILCYHAFKNVERTLKKQAVLISIYENQPFEKMLYIAFAGHRRIGYLHTIIPNNWLDYRKSKYENNMPLPEIILTTGRVWSDFLAAQYGKSSAIDIAGSLRYEHIWDSSDRSNNSKNIIVALPIYWDIAESIQNEILNILDNHRSLLSNYKVSIKPHPYLPSFAIYNDRFKNHQNCVYIDTPIPELLKDCALLITSGSTAAYEAVLTRVKTLYYRPEIFSDGTDHFIKDHLFIAHENDFKDVLVRSLNEKTIPAASKEKYFSVPDYEKFYSYVKDTGLNRND
ncbi:MAG: hypothetical protein ABII64_10680 [Elusimicrobiota bacterium]